jgi:hypothetical protein
VTDSKFKFPIFEDRSYTLDYGDFSVEVSGEDILSAFRRSAYLDKLIEELASEGGSHTDTANH